MAHKLHKFSTKTHKVLLTSDGHIFHKQPFIWQKRGFASIWEHAQWIRDGLNEEAKTPTILINLGDMFLNSTPEEVKAFLHSITPNITMYYFWGNHESSMYRIYQEGVRAKFGKDTDFDVYPFQVGNIVFMGYQDFVTIDGSPVFLTHFSPELWDGIQHGIACACGHSHGSLKSCQREDLAFRKLDVGIDNSKAWFGRPFIHYSEFREITKKKNVTVIDHHGPQVDSTFVCTNANGPS